MKKNEDSLCHDENNEFNHYLIEQITKICVQEQEERMEEEITNINK
jgi:hypothetical protein